MLRKGNEIKWNPKAKKFFEDIKATLNNAPMLSSLDFTKDFIMFSFASKHMIVNVLLQKDEQDFEKPIAYFRKTLRNAPLRNNIM
jgi:hypothetical protein